MAITEFIINPAFLLSGDVKNLSLMSGSVAGADMYIPGTVTRAGYYVFPGDSIVGFCDSTHEFDVL
jgi:hypothetical protein